MKKRILLIIMICMILISNTGVANAMVTLNCFYADTNQIAYNSGRAIYSINHDGFSSTDFNTYVNYAKDQWGNGGMNTSYASRLIDSTIDIHGGTVETLKTIDSDIENYWALTVMQVATFKGTTTYQGQDIGVFSIERAMVLCPKYSILFCTTNGYKNMFTHELGHSLGWIGHSTNTSDVMQSSPSGSRTTLTTRDISHIKQM